MSLMLYMSCADLTSFLVHGTPSALQPAVSMLDERRGDLVQGSAHFFL